MAIVQKGGDVYQDKMSNFIDKFRCYEIEDEKIDESQIHRTEEFKGKKKIYSFEKFENLKEIQTSFEDKFLGFVGKY